jgi:AbrB family looped-hinge helix DNA binding protein
VPVSAFRFWHSPILVTPEIVVFLPGITKEPAMETTSVTSKGQVTIPKPLRQRLGLRQGSKVEFVLVGDRVEMRIVSKPADLPASGFGMLRSKRVAVAADFDPAGLLARGKTGRSK